MIEIVSFGEMLLRRLPTSVTDSLASADPTFQLPPGDRRSPFPLSAESLLLDRQMFGHIQGALTASRLLNVSRERMLAEAELLDDRVQRALGE
ncbi:MAG: hypothetical protein ACR2MC_03570 [Actinomycetota bacterium]